MAEILKITSVTQTSGHVVDAINFGLKPCDGDVLAFLDDDAVPSSDWLESILKNYESQNVGGVAGEVISSCLKEGKIVQLNGKSSEIIPDAVPFSEIARKLWSCPIDGLENYLVYVSKAGMVNYNFEVANQGASRKHEIAARHGREHVCFNRSFERI